MKEKGSLQSPAALLPNTVHRSFMVVSFHRPISLRTEVFIQTVGIQTKIDISSGVKLNRQQGRDRKRGLQNKSVNDVNRFRQGTYIRKPWPHLYILNYLILCIHTKATQPVMITHTKYKFDNTNLWVKSTVLLIQDEIRSLSWSTILYNIQYIEMLYLQPNFQYIFSAIYLSLAIMSAVSLFPWHMDLKLESFLALIIFLGSNVSFAHAVN